METEHDRAMKRRRYGSAHSAMRNVAGFRDTARFRKECGY